MKAQVIKEVVVKEDVSKMVSSTQLEAIIDTAIKSTENRGIINKVSFKKALGTLTLF